MPDRYLKHRGKTLLPRGQDFLSDEWVCKKTLEDNQTLNPEPCGSSLLGWGAFHGVAWAWLNRRVGSPGRLASIIPGRCGAWPGSSMNLCGHHSRFCGQRLESEGMNLLWLNGGCLADIKLSLS